MHRRSEGVASTLVLSSLDDMNLRSTRCALHRQYESTPGGLGRGSSVAPSMTYLLVCFGMFLNVAAQVALKLASTPSTAVANGVVANPLADPWGLATNPYFLVGLVLYAVSVINWVVVLSRIDLSVAYPLMSVGYILTLVAGVWLFHEPISHTRIIGVVTIMIGVVLITRPVVAHG